MLPQQATQDFFCIAVAKQVMLWEPSRSEGCHNINHLNPLGGCYIKHLVKWDKDTLCLKDSEVGIAEGLDRGYSYI